MSVCTHAHVCVSARMRVRVCVRAYACMHKYMRSCTMLCTMSMGLLHVYMPAILLSGCLGLGKGLDGVAEEVKDGIYRFDNTTAAQSPRGSFVAVCRHVCGDMRLDMRVDMCVDMCVDRCVDMCIDMCADMRADMCVDMCVDMWVDMRADMCVDMWVDMRADMWVDMFIPVCVRTNVQTSVWTCL